MGHQRSQFSQVRFVVCEIGLHIANLKTYRDLTKMICGDLLFEEAKRIFRYLCF